MARMNKIFFMWLILGCSSPKNLPVKTFSRLDGIYHFKDYTEFKEFFKNNWWSGIRLYEPFLIGTDTCSIVDQW